MVVYPFAALVNDVHEAVPRVLFNKEAVGPFRNHTNPENYRDVAVLGDCDEGVLQLVKLLGWENEL